MHKKFKEKQMNKQRYEQMHSWIDACVKTKIKDLKAMW